MANVVKHLKFGSTTYDLPEGKNVLNLLYDGASGADIGSFDLHVDVYDDQGTPNTSVQFATYGNTTKTKIQTASSWGQNTDFDMNIVAQVNGVPCVLTKYSETSGGMVWNYRGFGHRFSFDPNSNNLYEFDFELNLGINLSTGAYVGNLSGDFYSISNVAPASGGSSSGQLANQDVAHLDSLNGQIRSVIYATASCVDFPGMNLGATVYINNSSASAFYLHSLGHNFESGAFPGNKYESLEIMDLGGILQPNDNITLNLYFLTSQSNLQKVSISGTYDSKQSDGGYLYYLDASSATITNAQYVGA